MCQWPKCLSKQMTEMSQRKKQPEGNSISALFMPEELAATRKHLKPGKSPDLDYIFPEFKLNTGLAQILVMWSQILVSQSLSRVMWKESSGAMLIKPRAPEQETCSWEEKALEPEQFHFCDGYTALLEYVMCWLHVPGIRLPYVMVFVRVHRLVWASRHPQAIEHLPLIVFCEFCSYFALWLGRFVVGGFDRILLS